MHTDIHPIGTPLQIDWEPMGQANSVNLKVFAGDDLIHSDKIDLSRANSRRNFAIRLCEDHAGIDRDEVESKLLAIIPEMERRRKQQAAQPRAIGGAAESPYIEGGGCFFHQAEGLHGPVKVRLSNFVARIEREVVRDDGDEQTRSFQVVGRRCDGRPLSAEVPSAKFAEMAWVVEQFGAGAIIEAGSRFKDHVRAAIQHRSAGYSTLTTYAHTGWREVDGEWIYLHAGGAIGAGGLDESIVVDLGKSLEKYDLPAPPAGDERRAAVRASLGLLRFGQEARPGSRAVAATTVAYPYRAAIGPASHSGQYTGLTGCGKTCMAALALQHYGRLMNYRDGMPANWDSTANRLEGLMHAVKDALLVIDDFVPGGSTHDVARAHKDAERVFRTQGNGRGRERLGPDGRLKPSKPPRGSVISTGEDRVRRKSADARTLPIRFVREDPANQVLGTVDKAILTDCQRDADAGLYASAMSAFIRWLAPRYEGVRGELSARARELRPLATMPGCHARTPDIVADLAAGFDIFLSFAVSVGAVSNDEAEAHRSSVWDGLMEAATPSGDEDGASAAEVYLRLVGAAMASHQAHLADRKTGGCPTPLEAACGWRKDAAVAGQSGPSWHVPPGSLKIGWTDGVSVLLEPDAAYQVAQKMATAQGESFAVSKATVHAQLDEAKKLTLKDSRNQSEGRNRLTTRVVVERSQKPVLVLAGSEFWGRVQGEDSAPAEREGAPY